MLTQGEIESQLMAVADTLETETDRHADLAAEAASAEAAYKHKVHTAWVSLAAARSNAPGEKQTDAMRNHRVEAAAIEEFRSWKITDARRVASREALLSLRARLDALRTLSANVRAQT